MKKTVLWVALAMACASSVGAMSPPVPNPQLVNDMDAPPFIMFPFMDENDGAPD
jgi:hypothetical protein